MKVVKCLKHIPKFRWGSVLEDTTGVLWIRDSLDSYTLKPSDTFPLPQQGDRIDISNNCINWTSEDDPDAVEIFKMYDEDEKLYIVKFKDSYYGCKYIRPIEEKEEKRFPTLTEYTAIMERMYKIWSREQKTDKS